MTDQHSEAAQLKSEHKQNASVYLGDGLYASHDGYQIKLAAPRGYKVDEVYLEPAVFQRLLDYAKQIGLLQ